MPTDRLLVPICDGPTGAGHALGGLSKRMIYMLVDTGDLTKVNVGRRVFITSASIASYVNRITEAATAGGAA